MRIHKEYKYNGDYYDIYLKQDNQEDTILEIKYKCKLLKTFKVINDSSCYYKIQKKQIKSNDIWQLIAEINDRNTTNVADVFIGKVLSQFI